MSTMLNQVADGVWVRAERVGLAPVRSNSMPVE